MTGIKRPLGHSVNTYVLLEHGELNLICDYLLLIENVLNLAGSKRKANNNYFAFILQVL